MSSWLFVRHFHPVAGHVLSPLARAIRVGCSTFSPKTRGFARRQDVPSADETGTRTEEADPSVRIVPGYADAEPDPVKVLTNSVVIAVYFI